MGLRDLVDFAVTALARHRVRTVTSLIGVMIGVAAVIIMTGIGEGARRHVDGQFASIGSRLVVILPGRSETSGVGGIPEGVAPNDLTLEDARILSRRLTGTVRMAPVVMGSDEVSFQERRRRVTIVGSTHAFAKTHHLEIQQGEFLSPGDMDQGNSVVILGSKVAREIFADASPIPAIVRVGAQRMRVIGVLKPKGQQLGLDIDDIVLVPAATSLRMFNRTSMSQLLVEADAHADLDGVCRRAVDVITELHGEEDVTCLGAGALMSSLMGILTVLTFALSGFAAISLTVAGIGIMNLMLVSVSERTKEVGLLKAVGARRFQVVGLFLAEAVILSTAGGALGLLVGWLGVALIGFVFPQFPAATPVWAATSALAVSALVGALFGVLPARRAARLDPVLALAGG
jgi:putative ABC transport system permease protein